MERYYIGKFFKVGDTVEVSASCNPDYRDLFGRGCEKYKEKKFCKKVEVNILFANDKNADGLWQTGQNCPQCGCDEHGPKNIFN